MVNAGRLISKTVVAFFLVAGQALIPASFSVAATPQATASETPSAISTAPLFSSSFKDFNRKMQPLGQYKGKLVVVYFWATWCASCRAEVPELIALHEKYKAKMS